MLRRASDEIVINGKFLLATLEGMPRVARELTAAFDILLDDSRFSGTRICLLAPPGAAKTISLRNIAVQEIGNRDGLLWEQIDLALHLQGRYCINFTGTAPILTHRGCVVVHDAQFRSTPASHGLKSSLLYGVITPMAARNYQTVVTISNFAKEEILKYKICNRSDIHIINNGVDHIISRSEDTGIFDRINLDPGDYLLANSYVHAHKNVPILFEALRDTPELSDRLVLFGTSTRADYEARGIEVPAGVIFTGRVSDETLVALMRNAKAFLFPSKTEGFGLPPLEAMLLGCPTICAAAGAMPELCAGGAWFASPDDASAWKVAIERVWNDLPARTELAEAGRRTASRYRWIDAATRYLDLVIAESQRSRRN